MNFWLCSEKKITLITYDPGMSIGATGYKRINLSYQYLNHLFEDIHRDLVIKFNTYINHNGQIQTADLTSKFYSSHLIKKLLTFFKNKKIKQT